MNKIFDRKPETDRLIAFLSQDTDIRVIKYDELVKAVANGKCRGINDIRAYLSAARRVMHDKHGTKYGTIRGEGIQRMDHTEIGFYGPKRMKRAAKQLKEVRRDNALVAGSNSISAEAAATVAVTEVIAVKLLNEMGGVKKMIKVATQNGAQAVADILASVNRSQA